MKPCAAVNSKVFGLLAIPLELKEHPVYTTGVAPPLESARWGLTGLVAMAWKRRLEQR
jgi:hypothetical protein